MTTKPIVERKELDKGVKLFQMDKTPTLEALLFEELMGASVMRQLVREFVRDRCYRYDTDASKNLRRIRTTEAELAKVRKFREWEYRDVENYKQVKRDMQTKLVGRKAKAKRKLEKAFQAWMLDQFWRYVHDAFDEYYEKLKRERK